MIVAGTAITVVSFYQLAILPALYEWSTSQHEAYQVGLQRFAVQGSRETAEADREVETAVLLHFVECYPEPFEWVWKRLRLSQEELAGQALAGFLHCLDDVARDAKGAGLIRAKRRKNEV